MASTKQVMQGKGSIAVSEEDGRYRIVRYIAPDFSLDSLTLGVCRTLSGKASRQGLESPGNQRSLLWGSGRAGMCVSHWHLLGIQPREWVALELFSEVKRRMFSVTPWAWGTEQVFWMSK